MVGLVLSLAESEMNERRLEPLQIGKCSLVDRTSRKNRRDDFSGYSIRVNRR